jgi:PKD repeat protein
VPITFDWDFGDGNTASGAIVVHAYDTAGDYTVVMTATNACGQDAALHTVTVLPAVCEPVAIVSVTTAISGCVVDFGAQLDGDPPFTYTWDFGAFGGSTDPNPTVDFASSGTYPYTLTATNCDDTESDTYVGEVTVSCEPPCTPVEIVTVTTAISGCVVDFGAQLNGDPPFTYTWDFGAFGNSTDPTPTVDFAASGTYPYTLTVTNCDDTESDTYIGEVAVACCEPVHGAAFNWFPVTPAVDEVVTFQGSAAGTEPIAYEWDFGDGNGSAGATVTHTYAATGTYTVMMTASNGCGLEVVSEAVTVVLTPTCTPVEIVTVTTIISGCVVDFDAQLDGDPPFLYAWDFGAFGSSTDPTPTVDFAASGVYPYTLTVTNCEGEGEDTVIGEVAVSCEPPCDPVHDVAFTWFPVTPAVDEVVTLQGSAAGTEPIAYDWDFGDTGMGAGQTVTHTYAATGTYSVVMTASNDCGFDVVSEDITVVLTPTCTPVEVVTVTTDISGCVVDFGAQLYGDPPFTYTWDFGDFGSSSDPNPTVDLAASGTYPYTLTVDNPCGGDTLAATVSVDCTPPPPTYEIYLPLVFKSATP